MLNLATNFCTHTDINQWINGQVGNLHLVWENHDTSLYLSQPIQRQFEILCYDAQMNQLICPANEIPHLSGNSSWYLSRAVLPDNTKYIKIYLKVTYAIWNGQFDIAHSLGDTYEINSVFHFETKFTQYIGPVTNL